MIKLNKHGAIGPKWINIYGPPLIDLSSEYDVERFKNELAFGKELGSHYRGRVLIQVTG